MKPHARNARFLSILLALAAMSLVPLTVSAEEILILVTERSVSSSGDEQVSFWWSTTDAPAWTKTDAALQQSLVGQGAQVASSVDLSGLSTIYRRPEPTDANALAMASVFGVNKVLVGTVTYRPTALMPVGLRGIHAVADLRLFDRSAGVQRTLSRIELDRRSWAMDDAEATRHVRRELSTAVARTVAGSLEQRSGPVGVASDELLIGIEGDKTRIAIDAVRAKLATLAGVDETRIRWASEGLIVLEVNPGGVDAAESVRQYVSLLVSEGAKGFAVAAVESKWPNVATLRVKRVEQETP